MARDFFRVYFILFFIFWNQCAFKFDAPDKLKYTVFNAIFSQTCLCCCSCCCSSCSRSVSKTTGSTRIIKEVVPTHNAAREKLNVKKKKIN